MSVATCHRSKLEGLEGYVKKKHGIRGTLVMLTIHVALTMFAACLGDRKESLKRVQWKKKNVLYE